MIMMIKKIIDSVHEDHGTRLHQLRLMTMTTMIVVVTMKTTMVKTTATSLSSQYAVLTRQSMTTILSTWYWCLWF